MIPFLKKKNIKWKSLFIGGKWDTLHPYPLQNDSMTKITAKKKNTPGVSNPSWTIVYVSSQ